MKNVKVCLFLVFVTALQTHGNSTEIQAMRGLVAIAESNDEITETNVAPILKELIPKDASLTAKEKKQELQNTIEMVKDLRADEELRNCYRLNIMLHENRSPWRQNNKLIAAASHCKKLTQDYFAAKKFTQD